MLWTPEPLRIRRWRSSPNSAISDFSGGERDFACGRLSSLSRGLTGDPAPREGIKGVISGINISRNVLKASRRAKRAKLGNEVYLQVTHRTENVLSETTASWINKHANLVLLIKTRYADGDDPGLE